MATRPGRLPQRRPPRTPPRRPCPSPPGPDGRARAPSCSRVLTRGAPAANQAARSPRSPGFARTLRSAVGVGLRVNGRVSGGGRGCASRMNERNVPRVRRRARPGPGANGSAGRARDPALRATAARRREDERRRRERAERGGRGACGGRALPLRGRTAVPGGGGGYGGGGDGDRAGVRTRDAGPCGTGSAGR
ncbi:alanine and glycine-rich protein-like [Talpa occidentalis]|uniref:alanine and glycine-rich protein-like n=1 Tax=Talpa occidentalis TaxID=50954 RepID=UPI00188EE0C8|nr:alanine and glycine-rich protein-like [Talpa occidentalis]